nr:protein PRRC2C-like [Setaria viridis]
MSAAKSASTHEKSRGTKAMDTALGEDEAVSEEMAMTDPEVGDVAVNMVPERVPSTDTRVAPELTASTPSDIMPPIADQAVLGLPAGAAGTVKEVSPVLATGTLLSNVIASGLGEKTAPVDIPTAPSTRPPVAEKKRVRLPPRSTRDAEETTPVETGIVPDPSTTTSVPLEDLTVEEVPEVDAGRLGATMSMLQDVIHSLDVPAAASGSGSAALSLSTGGSLAVVDVEKAKQTTAPGATLGTIPHLVESTRRAVLSLKEAISWSRNVPD